MTHHIYKHAPPSRPALKHKKNKKEKKQNEKKHFCDKRTTRPISKYPIMLYGSHNPDPGPLSTVTRQKASFIHQPRVAGRIVIVIASVLCVREEVVEVVACCCEDVYCSI